MTLPVFFPRASLSVVAVVQAAPGFRPVVKHVLDGLV